MRKPASAGSQGHRGRRNDDSHALDVDHPTKHRYRAAASSFVKYLVKREFIVRNFARDIDGYGENDPRLVYYEIADAKRVMESMGQPYAAISATALAFCME